MKVLVCGGRKYGDKARVAQVLNPLLAQHGVGQLLVIEGGAPGADTLAREWAQAHGVHVATVPALWDTYRNAAGPRRNRMMLLLAPELCVAFPGGSGTAHMVEECKLAGVPVKDVAEMESKLGKLLRGRQA